MLFGSFASVLWVLSKDFSIVFDGKDHALPGFMLWAAILYAVAGSLMTYWVGNGLISRNAERYAREGELRFSLTRISEHLDGISLAGGEADEKRRVAMHLGDVLHATSRVVLGLTNLTWVTAGFGWITVIAPTLVAAPLYFSGKVSFGGLMMAAAAFTQAQSSLRWFVDNFSGIADWRATLLRVAGLRQVLASDLEAEQRGSRIAYVEGEPGTLAIEALEVRAWTGHDRLDAESLVVHAGQRLLILGTPGTEKTLLFRALAGLWPWGSGTVRRPRGETIHYMPRGTPYLPRGTLAEALSYAMEPSSYPREAMVAALASVGLQRLEPLLDKTGRWERELSIDEQLLLGFARVVLQAPPWLVMDEAFGAFDDDTLELIIDVLNGKLAHTGIVHIGSAGEAHDRLFTQVVHLVKAPNAVPEEPAAMSEPSCASRPRAAGACAAGLGLGAGFRLPATARPRRCRCGGRDARSGAAHRAGLPGCRHRCLPGQRDRSADRQRRLRCGLRQQQGPAPPPPRQAVRRPEPSARFSTASMRVRARSKRRSASASPRPMRARSRSWCRRSTTRRPRPS